MRFYEKCQIVISEDSLQIPKKIRFSDEFEDTDVSLLKESITRQESFPVGTHSISMGNIAQGKFVVIKPTNDLQVKFDSGVNHTFKGGKLSKMWISFTSLEITVSTAEQVVVLGIAGE